jgi:DNA-binding CsgD family transcriptional regulator
MNTTLKSEKILALSNYLAMSPKSYNDISQFLVMNTFSDMKASCIYIGELIETGFVCAIGGFGWTLLEYEAITDLPIQDKFPVTDAIRTNQVQIIENESKFLEDFPLMGKFSFSGAWMTGIAIPVYPIGGMALYSTIRFELDEETKLFFVAIGSLLGLYASRLPVELVKVAINVKQKLDLPQIPLSDRQLVIAGLLERGFNNAQIGIEIGYSESLIRQETVAIYRKLQVTGRKALQAIRTLNLEAENNLDTD